MASLIPGSFIWVGERRAKGRQEFSVATSPFPLFVGRDKSGGRPKVKENHRRKGRSGKYYELGLIQNVYRTQFSGKRDLKSSRNPAAQCTRRAVIRALEVVNVSHTGILRDGNF